MINHARTLLLNVSGTSSGVSSDPGAEFVLPTFRPITLPGYLQRTRNLLFGAQPDAVMLNYRARQYMGLLHSTELVEFVTELDPRITYDVLPRDDLFDRLFTTTVRKLGSTTAVLSLVGDVGSPGQSGRTYHSWRIDVTSGSTVSVNRQTPPAAVSIQDYTISEGLSSLIQLTGSGLQARFSEGVGSEWFVESYSRPSQDLGTIAANLRVIGEDTLLQLFGVGTAKGGEEPFTTFYQLWKKHPELPYQLGGLLLAWIYQANDILQARP